ncbi:zinc finger protein 426-like isoform X2 [Equus quagga]|uniref:zinc finger protein 426-like isoform X2 n=1 Tax=Equus quagga TaxID=89248 RepID=UPI001EE2F854|nr:zinc finger protein 426-like isoform X2 [Equus quagga]
MATDCLTSCSQDSVSFADVAVHFTQEEWTLLGLTEKNLYRDVMLENYKNLTTVGYQLFKPNVISWLEEEELGTVERVLEEWAIQLKTKDSAIQQERIPSGWELYDCEQCGKHFSECSCLETHRRAHDGGNPHDDDQYGKSFLTLQKKTSTGEKLFMLNQLGKAISPTLDIVYWKTSMQGEDFECSDGGKAFADHSYLWAQMRTHNGEKLHERKECGRSFIHSTSVGVHIQTHTGNSHYECNECGKSFKGFHT